MEAHPLKRIGIFNTDKIVSPYELSCGKGKLNTIVMTKNESKIKFLFIFYH